jgi:MFS family permease
MTYGINPFSLLQPRCTARKHYSAHDAVARFSNRGCCVQHLDWPSLTSIFYRAAQGTILEGKRENLKNNTNTVERARIVSRNVIVLQFLWGCSYGCYIFVYGAWYVWQLSAGKFYHEGLVPAGILLTIRQALGAFLDIPLGVLADRFGRLTLVRFAFVAKLMFHGTLASLALVSRWYPPILAGVGSSIFFAIAYTSFSGAFSAWVVSESRESGINDPSTVLAAGHYAFFFGELLTGVVSVLLFSWKSPACFLLGATFCAIAWIWAVSKCQEHRSTAPAQLNKFVRVPEMARRFRERFQALRKVISTSQIVLAVMMIFGCFMFLLNIVEHFWPVLVKAYKGSSVPLEQKHIWMIFVLLVCVVRLAGAHLFKNRLNAIKSIPIELKIRRVKPLFLLCGLSAAAVAIVVGIVVGISVHSGSGSSQLQAEITAARLFISLSAVLFLVFIHGLVAPLYDVLVNAVMPASLDSYRAAVLSIGSTVRSVLAILFGVLSAAAISGWSWAVPGSVLLIVTLGANAFMKRRSSV